MGAGDALQRLIEESAQIEAACMFDADGTTEASTLTDESATRSLVEAARALVSEAENRPRDPDAGPLAQLEVATHDGSVFVVREGDRAVVAVTKPEPTVGLVFYDLKSCLRTTRGETNSRPRRRGADSEEASTSETAA